MPLVAWNSRCELMRLSSHMSMRIHTGTLGNLDLQERLDGHGECELVEQRRRVVHAGDVGGALQVRERLSGLLHAGMEVADDGLAPQNGLGFHLEHQPQHAVGTRMLRSHVDDHAGCRRARPQRRPAPPPRPRSCAARGCSPGDVPCCRRPGRSRPLRRQSSAGLGRLELHGNGTDAVVLAQRVTLPVVGHEDPAHVGMAFEDDAEHVVGLALEGLGPGILVEKRGQYGVVFGHLHPEADAGRSAWLINEVTTSNRCGSTPGGRSRGRIEEVVDCGHVDAHDVPVGSQRPDHVDVGVAARDAAPSGLGRSSREHREPTRLRWARFVLLRRMLVVGHHLRLPGR